MPSSPILTLPSYPAKIAPSKPTVAWRSVLPKIENNLEGKYNGWNVTLEYLAQGDGSISLVHVVQIQNENSGAWYEAYVDAHSGELTSVTDFVSDASVSLLLIIDLRKCAVLMAGADGSTLRFR